MGAKPGSFGSTWSFARTAGRRHFKTNRVAVDRQQLSLDLSRFYDFEGKAVIYVGPTLIADGGDRIPVTLSFQRNPRTGRLDLVLHIEDQQYLFPNTGTRLVPPSSGK